MPSNKPFAFDVEKLSKFVYGDIGIAQAIYDAQIAPILSAIPNTADKDIFKRLSAPDKKTGIWAIERTIVSSMLESQKPFIELAKICLEMFGGIEYTIKVLLGGQNPLNDPSSFAGAFKANKAKMDEFSKSTTPDIPEEKKPILPSSIFLGKWERTGLVGDVHSSNGQPTDGQFWIGSEWPQYQNVTEFRSAEEAKLNALTIGIDEETKQSIVDGRFSSINDEWSEMQEGCQLRDKYESDIGNINISKWYRPLTKEYLGENVEIDIENDYDIFINKIYHEIGNTEYITINAVLKPEAVANTDGNQQNESTASPESFTVSPTSLVKAVKAFMKMVLPVILKKLLPVIISLQKILTDPAGFIGDILMTKLKEHFEMFDPSIKGTPTGDKYWSGDKFVLDGIAVINAGILKLTLGLENGTPTFKAGADPLDSTIKEQPILKQVANIVALPINLLKGILDAFKELMKKLFTIPSLPDTMSDFISFEWIKKLLKLPKLLEFLGAVDGDITKIPFLAIPEAGNMQLVPDMIKAFLKMIVHFLNGFISIPNTILNMELVPQIPLPE